MGLDLSFLLLLLLELFRLPELDLDFTEAVLGAVLPKVAGKLSLLSLDLGAITGVPMSLAS